MTDDAFEIVWRNISDESIPQRDLSTFRARRYDFFIGKHGPFTERVPLDNFDPGEITRRVETLRAQLRALPK